MVVSGSIRSSTRSGFAYTPPERVYRGVRVLVVANQITPEVLANVLRGLWRFSPVTRVLVVEHEALTPTMMNDNMRSVDLNTLPMRPYLNRYVEPPTQVIAPSLLAEVDACIALNTLSSDDLTVSPSLAVLRDLTQNNADLLDTYFAIGHLFAGSLVDTGDKLIWGDHLLDVDESASLALGQPPAPEIAKLRAIMENRG